MAPLGASNQKIRKSYTCKYNNPTSRFLLIFWNSTRFCDKACFQSQYSAVVTPNIQLIYKCYYTRNFNIRLTIGECRCRISSKNNFSWESHAFNIQRANPKGSLVTLPKLSQLHKMEESIQSHWAHAELN